MVNKQTVAPPIPHLHALLTSGDDPPPEIDVFDLIKASYEVRVMSENQQVSSPVLRYANLLPLFLCRSSAACALTPSSR